MIYTNYFWKVIGRVCDSVLDTWYSGFLGCLNLSQSMKSSFQPLFANFWYEGWSMRSHDARKIFKKNGPRLINSPLHCSFQHLWGWNGWWKQQCCHGFLWSDPQWFCCLLLASHMRFFLGGWLVFVKWWEPRDSAKVKFFFNVRYENKGVDRSSDGLKMIRITILFQ